MLERKAANRFHAWRQRNKNHALLVSGARQVGKSFLLDSFTREAYGHVVAFDLVRDAAACRSFAAAADADDLAFRIGMMASTPLVPQSTVVFIDEVQECPEVVTYAKYLVSRGDYDYVISGSLLGVELEGIRSYPVGYLTEVCMHPLDFEEFCWACGVSHDVRAVLEACLSEERPVPDYLHERLMRLFHRYLLVGGMPDAVNAYLETNSIDAVRTVHENIRRQYRRDIAKYAPKDRRLVIRDIFDRIPSQLSQQNRRFQLSSIANVKRYTQIEDEFLWLVAAGVAIPAYNVVAPAYPLLVNEQRRLFKLFSSDVGLLSGAYLKADTAGILDGRPGANMGGAYENFVAQELTAHGFTPFYFTKAGVGELDLLVQRRDGTVVALEVKSGASYRTHATIDKALATTGYAIDEAYVLANRNVERDGSVLYLPLYMVGLFEN